MARDELTPEHQAKILAEFGYDGIGYSGGNDLDEHLAVQREIHPRGRGGLVHRIDALAGRETVRPV